MHIGIDVRVLGNPIKSGIEEYAEQLLSRLLPLDSSIRYKLFFSSYRHELPDYDWLRLPNVEVKKFKYPNHLLAYSTRIFSWPKIDRLLDGVDVFFSPHFLISSLSPTAKRVTAFHDLSYLRFPGFFSWRQKIWHNFEMRPVWQARMSDKIIAVSESTKNDLVEKYAIDPANIKVIYSGASLSMRLLNPEELADFRKSKDLPERFILFMGKLEPRKNIVGLIRAFNLLKNDNQFDDLALVVAGDAGWLYGDIFKEAVDSLHKNQIRFAGHISNEERAGYYNLASVFVYPSFFEGFGLPALEAMACGAPVIASNNSSLPEVVGDAGILVNPHNVSEIAAAMRHMLTDIKLRKTIVEKGLARASKFTWQKCAEETLEVLTSV